MAYKTRQKEAIRAVIEASSRPLTALDICDQASTKVQSLGIATVYRTLKQLVEEGHTRHIEVPGAQPHYESSARHHHHFFLCERCHRLSDLTGCLQGLASLLPPGYRMKRHEIVLYGDCPGCAKAA